MNTDVIRKALGEDLRERHEGHLLAQRVFVDATCTCDAHGALDEIDAYFALARAIDELNTLEGET